MDDVKPPPEQLTAVPADPSECFEPTERTTLKRHRERGSYDRAESYEVIDEALYCHVAVMAGEHPIALPTAHARIGDRLYLHGARSNRMFNLLAQGGEACLTFTLIDGLVFAYSAFSHSMNYRCVVALGRGREVTDLAEKQRALAALIEHMAPGRMAEIRPPNPQELAATLVVAVPLEEASLKRREGPPLDKPDEPRPPGTWAGVLPVRTVAGAAIPSSETPAESPALASRAWQLT
jgi:nitroimidazol reductase NimA-like FMN-containing flavoprotein (pyridoxamine 5'-phosphate oxidase superfamily)